MKEKAPRRKLPSTVGANGDQKDSDSGETLSHHFLSRQSGSSHLRWERRGWKGRGGVHTQLTAGLAECVCVRVPNLGSSARVVDGTGEDHTY